MVAVTAAAVVCLWCPNGGHPQPEIPNNHIVEVVAVGQVEVGGKLVEVPLAGYVRCPTPGCQCYSTFELIPGPDLAERVRALMEGWR
jgi:hypothetical protein